MKDYSHINPQATKYAVSVSEQHSLFIVFCTRYSLEALPLVSANQILFWHSALRNKKDIMHKVHLNSEKLLTYGVLTFKKMHSCQASLSEDNIRMSSETFGFC